MNTEDNNDNTEKLARQAVTDSNISFGLGAGVGAFGILGAMTAGAVCPVCIVATPALIGLGIYQRVRARRLKQRKQ